MKVWATPLICMLGPPAIINLRAIFGWVQVSLSAGVERPAGGKPPKRTLKKFQDGGGYRFTNHKITPSTTLMMSEVIRGK